MTATIRRDATRTTGAGPLGSVTADIRDLWGTHARITGHPTAVAAVRAVLVNDNAPRVGFFDNRRRAEQREHVTVTLTGPDWAVLAQHKVMQHTLVITLVTGPGVPGSLTVTCRPGPRVDFGRAGGAR